MSVLDEAPRPTQIISAVQLMQKSAFCTHHTSTKIWIPRFTQTEQFQVVPLSMQVVNDTREPSTFECWPLYSIIWLYFDYIWLYLPLPMCFNKTHPIRRMSSWGLHWGYSNDDCSTLRIPLEVLTTFVANDAFGKRCENWTMSLRWT